MIKLEDLALEVLRYKEEFGKNYKGIAEAVGLTENMLKTHMLYIKRVLRNYKYDRANVKAIASDLNISEVLSEILLDNYTPKSIMKIGKRITKKEQYELIDLAIECGAETMVEIYKLTDLSYFIVRKLVKENEEYESKIKSKIEPTISKIKSLVLKGITDVNEIAEKLSRTPERIYRLSLEEEVPITSTPKLKVKKRNPHWDKLIKEGLTLQEIGDEVRKTEERIRQYVKGTGQYKIWRNARKSKKIEVINNTNAIKLKEGRDILFGIVRQTIENRVMNIPDNASPKEFADKYLGRYILKRRKVNVPIKYIFRKIDISDMYNLFRIYKEAKNKGERISLKGFEKRTGIFFYQVGRIFETAGLKPMFEDYSRNKK